MRLAWIPLTISVSTVAACAGDSGGGGGSSPSLGAFLTFFNEPSALGEANGAGWFAARSPYDTADFALPATLDSCTDAPGTPAPTPVETPEYLDAGATVTLEPVGGGTAVVFNRAVSADSVVYTIAWPDKVASGAYTATIAGLPDVQENALVEGLVLPADPALVTTTLVISSAAFAIEWTPSGAGAVFLGIESFVACALVDDGSFEVPAEMAAAVPPGAGIFSLNARSVLTSEVTLADDSTTPIVWVGDSAYLRGTWSK